MVEHIVSWVKLDADETVGQLPTDVLHPDDAAALLRWYWTPPFEVNPSEEYTDKGVRMAAAYLEVGNEVAWKQVQMLTPASHHWDQIIAALVSLAHGRGAEVWLYENDDDGFYHQHLRQLWLMASPHAEFWQEANTKAASEE